MKIIITVLLIVLMILPIVACERKIGNNQITDNNDNLTESTSINDASETESQSSSSQNSYPTDEYYMYRFKSPEGLLDSLTNIEDKLHIREYVSRFERYKDMLDRFERGEITLKYPVLEGYDEDFLTQDIVVFTREFLGMPWIWYRRWYDDTILLVKVTYLTDDVLEYSYEHSLWETLQYISPAFPSPDKMYDDGSVKLAKEEVISTKYGEVRAHIRDWASDDGRNMAFIIDDMLIEIRGTTENVGCELIDKLTFVPVK